MIWHDMAPASRATFVKDIRAMVEPFSKRSDSVLYNVILITRGTILFTPQNAQLLTRCHSIGISKVPVGGGNVPKLSAHKIQHFFCAIYLVIVTIQRRITV